MALVLADRVKEVTTTTGTGTITLGGPATQFQSFSTGIGDGNSCDYCLLSGDGTSWEVGNGVFTASGDTLTRATVYASSNSGSLITLAGSSTVFVPLAAFRIDALVGSDTYGYSQPTTGATITAADNEKRYVIDPAGTLATLTLTLPPTPEDGDIYEAMTSQTLTALTVNAPSAATVLGGAGFTLTANGGASWIYKSANTTWYRRY